MKKTRYATISLVNHGTYWSAGELRKLNSLVVSGLSWPQIGLELKREPSACKVQDAIIRKIELFKSLDDDATMRSLRKSNALVRLELNQPEMDSRSPWKDAKKGQSQVIIGKSNEV